MRRPGDFTPAPLGGRVAARRQMFMEQRSPTGDSPTKKAGLARAAKKTAKTRTKKTTKRATKKVSKKKR